MRQTNNHITRIRRHPTIRHNRLKIHRQILHILNRLPLQIYTNQIPLTTHQHITTHTKYLLRPPHQMMRKLPIHTLQRPRLYQPTLRQRKKPTPLRIRIKRHPATHQASLDLDNQTVVTQEALVMKETVQGVALAAAAAAAAEGIKGAQLRLALAVQAVTVAMVPMD